MIILKQNTVTDIILGCFIDDTDGKTPETALTIAQADVRLSKNAAAYAQKTDATSATHREHGYYMVDLDATDTGTLGMLDIHVHATGALPVYQTFMVVSANIYDSMCGTDTLQSDVVQMGGTAQSATDLKDFADTGYDPIDHKVTQVALSDVTTTNTDMRGTDNAALATELTAHDGKLDTVDGNVDSILVDTGTTIPADLATMKQTTAGTYNRDTDSLEAIRDRGDAAWVKGGSPPTVGEIADGVWDELKSGHTVPDSFGDYLDDEITSRNATTPPTVIAIRQEIDTNSTRLDVAVSSRNSVTPSVPGEYDVELADIKGTGFIKDTHSLPQCLTGAGGSSPTVNEIADGVWDELKSGHVIADSFGDYLDDEITSRAPASEYDTAMAHLDVDVSSRNAIAPNTVIPDVAGTAAGLHTTTDALVTTVDGVVDTILVDTNDLQTNQSNWLTATSVTVSDKTGFSLSAAGVDAILDEDIEGSHTMREMLRLIASTLVGKVSGGGTTTITFRDIDDSKNRIVATVTAEGNRTAMALTED